MTSAQIDTIQALEADNNRLKGEIKMKEELIPGMEKMIAYLHKLQEENKKLKEENKELKENLSHTEDMSWDYYGELLELREQNKILKEQNEEDFEEKAIQYVYQYTDHYDDWVKNSTLYQKLKKEVKLLQDQLEDDDDDKICDLLECDHDGRYDAIRELKDEYDELKDDNY